MFSYIKDILTAFEKADLKGKGAKSSAAPNTIFVVKEDCKKLDQGKVLEFQNLVAKNFYATKRVIIDTCTAISFLTKRVKDTDKDDWDKLVHLMRYIRGTSNILMTLSAKGSRILKWWVYASFAFHPNMQGHSGGCLYLGCAFPTVSSTKQNLNTNISTGT